MNENIIVNTVKKNSMAKENSEFPELRELGFLEIHEAIIQIKELNREAHAVLSSKCRTLIGYAIPPTPDTSALKGQDQENWIATMLRELQAIQILIKETLDLVSQL